jgi:hypothetical protein
MLTSSNNQYIRPEYLTPMPNSVSGFLLFIIIMVFYKVLDYLLPLQLLQFINQYLLLRIQC